MGQKQPKLFAFLSSIAIDSVLVLSVFLFGLFLIGTFLWYEYLHIGYQDWLFQAFQIKSLNQYGLTSWDHIWANGMNHWRLYQYLPHVLANAISNTFSVSLTKAMIIETVGIFTGNLVVSYIFMRVLHIKRIPILLSIATFLSIPQIWGPVKEFSIHFPMTLISVFIFFWARDISKNRHSFIVPALAGIAWIFHPTFAYVTAGLWLFSYSPQLSKQNLINFFSRLIIYLIISSIFWAPYIAKGYYFGSPFLSSSQFYRQNLPASYYGFGDMAFWIFALSWFVILLSPTKIPKWSKLLYVFITVYLVAIHLGQNNLLPKFILELQFARAVPLLGVMLMFASATVFSIVWPKNSRFLKTLGVIVLAFFITSAIGSSSQYAPQATNKIESPVAQYFKTNPKPTGSIYTGDVSTTSYFLPDGIRFVNSYFEQMLPHPHALRFGLLLRNDLAYTGISQKQATLLTSYSRVMGVEYLFLPKLSPSISQLIATDSGKQYFTKVYEPEKQDFVVLQNTAPIHNAYAVSDSKDLSFDLIKKPTLHADSWQEWDQRMLRLDTVLTSEAFAPLPLSFINNDQLEVDLTKRTSSSKQILITQSFDSNWKVVEPQGAQIKPTSERFIFVTLPEGTHNKLVLKNEWPAWHWPLQYTMIGATISVVGIESTVRLARKQRKRRIEVHEQHVPVQTINKQ